MGEKEKREGEMGTATTGREQKVGERVSSEEVQGESCCGMCPWKPCIRDLHSLVSCGAVWGYFCVSLYIENGSQETQIYHGNNKVASVGSS